MNFIMELIELARAFFSVLFAVPILGVLFLVGTLGPVIIKAAKHR